MHSHSLKRSLKNGHFPLWKTPLTIVVAKMHIPSRDPLIITMSSSGNNNIGRKKSYLKNRYVDYESVDRRSKIRNSLLATLGDDDYDGGAKGDIFFRPPTSTRSGHSRPSLSKQQERQEKDGIGGSAHSHRSNRSRRRKSKRKDRKRGGVLATESPKSAETSSLSSSSSPLQNSFRALKAESNSAHSHRSRRDSIRRQQKQEQQRGGGGIPNLSGHDDRRKGMRRQKSFGSRVLGKVLGKSNKKRLNEANEIYRASADHCDYDSLAVVRGRKGDNKRYYSSKGDDGDYGYNNDDDDSDKYGEFGGDEEVSPEAPARKSSILQRGFSLLEGVYEQTR